MRRVGWDGAAVALAGLAVLVTLAAWRPEGVGHWITIVLLADAGYLGWRARGG